MTSDHRTSVEGRGPRQVDLGCARFCSERLHYGSPEHQAHYATGRNTIEGINGTSKDGAYAALGDPARRRIRGVAAQSLFAALQLFATNVRKIRNFLRRARPDTTGVLRRRRKPRRTTRSLKTWKPPVPARSGAPPDSP